MIDSVNVLLLPYSTFTAWAKALCSVSFHWYLPPARAIASFCLSPVDSPGLRTIVLPAASAGATFQAAIISG